MTKRKAPYRHADGSDCWTKNCRRGRKILSDLKSNLTVGKSNLTFADIEKNTNSERTIKINQAMRNFDFSVLLPSIPTEQFKVDKNVLFKTIHGSHLYGLNHAGSDKDYYTVVIGNSSRANRKTRQTIVDGVDSLRVSLNHFMELAQSGSHQALEAMFSEKTSGDIIEAMRKNYYVGSNIFQIYERTIRNFALSDDFKRRRHALRLTLNLNEMTHRGRFNPTLTKEQAEEITTKTNSTFDEYFNYLNEKSEIEIQWQKTDRSHAVKK